MKTLEEFVKEINGSEELQKALKEINDKAALEEFIKKNCCGATAEEFAEYVKSQAKGGQGELSDDEASSVAGGVWFDIGFGRFWVDETLPERKKEKDGSPLYPYTYVTIEDE